MSPLEPDVGYVTFTANAVETEDEREAAFARAVQIARADYAQAWRSGSLQCFVYTSGDESAPFKPTSIVVGIVGPTTRATGIATYRTVTWRITAASFFDDAITPANLPRERIEQSDFGTAANVP